MSGSTATACNRAGKRRGFERLLTRRLLTEGTGSRTRALAEEEEDVRVPGARAADDEEDELEVDALLHPDMLQWMKK